MQPFQGLPDRALRGIYVPAAVADELTGLLLRLQALLAETSIEALGPLPLPGGYGVADADLALKLVLADVEHLIDLADYCNAQVSVARWEHVTDDLRYLVLTVADRV